MRIRGFNKWIKEVSENAGILNPSEISSHTARKTCASFLEGVGASDRMIKKALTHSGGLTDVYANSELSRLRDFLNLAFG